MVSFPDGEPSNLSLESLVRPSVRKTTLNIVLFFGHLFPPDPIKMTAICIVAIVVYEAAEPRLFTDARHSSVTGSVV